MNHIDTCEAPICVENNDDKIVWLPSELICTKRPFNSVQKKQMRINRAVKDGTFRNIDVPLTLKDLRTRLF